MRTRGSGKKNTTMNEADQGEKHEKVRKRTRKTNNSMREGSHAGTYKGKEIIVFVNDYSLGPQDEAVLYIFPEVSSAQDNSELQRIPAREAKQ